MSKRSPSRPPRRSRNPAAPPPETVFRAFVRTLERLDPTSGAAGPSAKRRIGSGPAGGDGP